MELLLTVPKPGAEAVSEPEPDEPVTVSPVNVADPATAAWDKVPANTPHDADPSLAIVTVSVAWPHLLPAASTMSTTGEPIDAPIAAPDGWTEKTKWSLTQVLMDMPSER